MVAQALHLLFGLGLHVVHKRFVAGVDVAGEHEVLPYQKPHLVAIVVEGFVLVESAAPNPYHVHIRLFGLLQELGVAVVAFAAGERARVRGCGNPVGTAHEERLAVDDELE